MKWYQPERLTSEQRFFHIERPFPWPLIVPLLALVAVVAWIVW